MSDEKMNQEKIQELIFQANGGYTGIAIQYIMSAINSIVLGALIHIGWNFIS